MYHNNSLKAIINSSDSSRNFGMGIEILVYAEYKIWSSESSTDQRV
jgi:hypothetical protein